MTDRQTARATSRGQRGTSDDRIRIDRQSRPAGGMVRKAVGVQHGRADGARRDPVLHGRRRATRTGAHHARRARDARRAPRHAVGRRQAGAWHLLGARRSTARLLDDRVPLWRHRVRQPLTARQGQDRERPVHFRHARRLRVHRRPRGRSRSGGGGRRARAASLRRRQADLARTGTRGAHDAHVYDAGRDHGGMAEERLRRRTRGHAVGTVRTDPLSDPAAPRAGADARTGRGLRDRGRYRRTALAPDRSQRGHCRGAAYLAARVPVDGRTGSLCPALPVRRDGRSSSSPLQAIARGSNVEWKGRAYVTTSSAHTDR